MSFLALEEISKSFAGLPVLQEVTLEIERGEIFFLLGPSGCGKTTLLRIVAGLTQPDSGRILLDGCDLSRMPAHRRELGMVFQDFALWPHLSIAENVSFGLVERRPNRAEQRARVTQALQAVRLDVDPQRSIRGLSGGQKQRVALARALATRPRCLLLDEPLSSLDAPLRADLRQEIRTLCLEHKLTALYVTHDPTEALAIGDRVGVIKQGRLTAVARPHELLQPLPAA